MLFMEIAVNTAFKIFSFSDINNLAVFIVIKIAARLVRNKLNGFF